MPKIVFYARVSTRDQNLNPQLDAAHRLGVKPEHIFVEKASGAKKDRPELAKALAILEKGDTLACFKLDRIARSLQHLLEILSDLEKRGVNFMTVEGDLNTKGSTGRLVISILGAIAQFERDLILERTRAGLASARARGKVPGRRRVMKPADVVRAKKLLEAGELTATEVANLLRVGRATMFRELRRARELEELGA